MHDGCVAGVVKFRGISDELKNEIAFGPLGPDDTGRGVRIQSSGSVKTIIGMSPHSG